MSNRFDSGSVSAYTPQSFQELSFTPMMKRAQHDEMSKNIAALDAIAADPLNEHRDEALKLKQEFESKLGNISGELASKGIDGIVRENFYRLKKEHDDLIAPTGRIGEINAAKIAEAVTKKQFFDSADKRIPQDVLERNWQEHRSKYTGYSDPEKTKIENIKSLGAVGYQDLEADMSRGKQLLGQTTDSTLLNKGAQIQHRPDLGGFIMVSGDGKELITTNDAQLKAYLADMNSKWLKEEGEGAKYNKFAGISTNNTADRILNSADMMREFKRDKSYNESQSFHQYSNSGGEGATEQGSSLYGDPYDTQTIGGEKQDFSEIEQIGNEKVSVSSALANSRTGLQGSTHKPMNLNGKWTTADIKDPIQKLLYDKAWKDATTGKGIMLTNGKIGHLTKESIALGKDDPTVRERLLNHLKLSTSETFQDKIIRTNQQYKANGFPGYANKDQDAQSKQVQNDLKIGGTEGRKIIVDGRPMELNKFLEKYDAKLEDISFSGIKSFDRIESKNDVIGSNGSKSSPLMITVKTKNGEYLPFTTTRISSDNQGINPSRMDDVQKNKLKIMLNKDEFQNFESSSKNLNGLKVRRNVNFNISYDPKTGELLEYTVKDKKGREHHLTSDQYLTSIISTR